MLIGFSKYFPWHTKDKPAPTYFREKILASAGYAWITMVYPQGKGKPAIEGESFAQKGYLLHQPKLHTIREGNRWKAGDLMHMAYGVRTKNYQQFNKGIQELERVKSVQKIEIKWYKDTSEIGKFATTIGIKHNDVKMCFDGKECIHVTFSDGGLSCAGVGYDNPKHVDCFKNDGFDGVYEFFKWFSKDFTGQILHFTNLIY